MKSNRQVLTTKTNQRTNDPLKAILEGDLALLSLSTTDWMNRTVA